MEVLNGSQDLQFLAIPFLAWPIHTPQSVQSQRYLVIDRRAH